MQQVSVLGELDVCSACAGGVLHVAAGFVVATATWVTELERLAGAMSWLDVARWSAQTPFGPPDPMPALLTALKGARGFAGHRGTTLAAWGRLRHRFDAALAAARRAAGPAGPGSPRPGPAAG